ncbi:MULTISPECIES: hypothetical protein [Lactobacillus]|uniref:YtxH domain-containing protein n=1 Tax=Lactobacillus xujianguonis TaxID=2495899 RepID=A0A437SUH7_9LACO|nr:MULTISPECIES: hypothetical protein [Lactobacillus]RVU70581.1 hypothetical protein EJK17_06730 [Lactobacillus xujianguonis]RVU73794.1 hypothetical protein EJK20_06320 [Lactobacillus xujianguonis]
MKNFGLGLFLGAAAGVALSLIKDEHGVRLGQPLKENIAGMQDAGESLADGIAKAKKASQELSANLPAAERAVSDISDDVKHYQNHIAPNLKEINYRSKKIQREVESTDQEQKNS